MLLMKMHGRVGGSDQNDEKKKKKEKKQDGIHGNELLPEPKFVRFRLLIHQLGG